MEKIEGLALAKQVAPRLPGYYAVYVMDAEDNHCITCGYFTDSRWSWVQEVVAGEFQGHPNDVACIETEDGDKITLNGKVVAYLAH